MSDSYYFEEMDDGITTGFDRRISQSRYRYARLVQLFPFVERKRVTKLCSICLDYF